MKKMNPHLTNKGSRISTGFRTLTFFLEEVAEARRRFATASGAPLNDGVDVTYGDQPM